MAVAATYWRRRLMAADLGFSEMAAKSGLSGLLTECRFRPASSIARNRRFIRNHLSYQFRSFWKLLLYDEVMALPQHRAEDFSKSFLPAEFGSTLDKIGEHDFVI
jgi:hypothetical protein